MSDHRFLAPAAAQGLVPTPVPAAVPIPLEGGGPGGGALPWRNAGLLMAVTFSLLQMLNEVGTLMAIPLYGSMSAELALTPSQVTWALLSTTLAGAITIALIAKAGDLFGHRRMMFLCLGLIIAGYVIAALAPSLTTLVIGRALVGIMAGQALCVGIMNDRLAVPDRKKAVAIIAAGQAIGVFLGFALGGAFVVLGLGWRQAFLAGGVLTIISLVGFVLWGRDSDAAQRHGGERKRLDLVGVGLLGLGLTALCVGISQSMIWGPGSLATLGTVVAGVVLLLAALVWESRAEDPLVSISELFSLRLLPAYGTFIAMGVSGMLLFNLVMGFALTPAAPVAYGFGLNPLQAAFLFIPQLIAGIVAARLVTRLLIRTSAKNVLLAAGLLLVATFLVLGYAHHSLWVMVVAIFFYGAAYTALFTTAVSVIAVEAHADKGAGTASIYVAMALAASSIGAALFSAIVGWGTDPVTLALRPETYTVGFWIGAAASLIAVVCGAALSRDVRLSRVASGH